MKLLPSTAIKKKKKDEKFYENFQKKTTIRENIYKKKKKNNGLNLFKNCFTKYDNTNKQNNKY